jgi:hypothetical protein
MRTNGLKTTVGVLLCLLAVSCSAGITNEEVDLRIHLAVTTAIAQVPTPEPTSTPITLPPSPTPVVIPTFVPPTPQPTATPQAFLASPTVFDEITAHSLKITDIDGNERLLISSDPGASVITISSGDRYVFAKAISVVDDRGQDRFTLRLDYNGEPELTLLDSLGRDVAEFKTDNLEPQINFLDYQEQIRLQLSLSDSESSPKIFFFDAMGTQRENIGLLSDGRPALAFRDAEGDLRVFLAEFKVGENQLQFLDSTGITVTEVFP